MTKDVLPAITSEIVLYQPDESISLEVKLDQETVWLTQAQMVELFQTSKQNVSLHISNIFKEGELFVCVLGKLGQWREENDGLMCGTLFART